MNIKNNIWFFLRVILCTLPGYACAQGISNLWMTGYSENGADFGGVDVNFYFNNHPDTFRIHRDMDFSRTEANICDSNGQLLFCTNGYDVADRNYNVLPNGHGLHGSPSPTSWASFGEELTQGAIILPDPGNPDHFFIIHENYDDVLSFPGTAGYFPLGLYCSEVDMTMNSGLGAVVNANTLVLDDSLAIGMLLACKHANGRDWWLIVPELGRPSYYTYLLSPSGLQLMFSQQIGMRDYYSGQGAFSPDGEYYAYFNWYSGLEVFNFDRCSGRFSNPQIVQNIDTIQQGWGFAFSANSKKIYVATGIFINQFDLTAPSLSASKTLVGIWDGYYDNLPFATIFGHLMLGPDGKIYISTGNSTHYLHTIENPDQSGVGCNLIQRSVRLPTWSVNSFPNHPNYFQGPVYGSICDTVMGAPKFEVRENVMSAYPNPSLSGSVLRIQYPTLNEGGGLLQMITISGEIILEESLPAWSQMHNLRIPAAANGATVVRVIGKSYMTMVKIFILKE